MNSPGFCCIYSQKLHKMAYQLSSKFFQARCIHFVELLYFLVQPAKQELHRWMKPRICLMVNDTYVVQLHIVLRKIHKKSWKKTKFSIRFIWQKRWQQQWLSWKQASVCINLSLWSLLKLLFIHKHISTLFEE